MSHHQLSLITNGPDHPKVKQTLIPRLIHINLAQAAEKLDNDALSLLRQKLPWLPSGIRATVQPDDFVNGLLRNTEMTH